MVKKEDRNKKKQTIIFDLDDTLSTCNEYYIQRIDVFVDLMISLFPNLKREEVMVELNKVDIKGVKKHGLSI